MFDLGSVVPANAEWRPQKTLISGVQGLGKGVFASTHDAPIMARIEDGAGNLDVPTFPNLIEAFADVEAVITELHKEHPYKTLILDTLDWLEPIVWAKQVADMPTNEKDNQVQTIEDYGYGKGYGFAMKWWRYLAGGFDSLRLNKGMAIILIAHVEVKRYDAPDIEPYDRYQIKLHKLAAAFWQEWADMVLFCNYKKRIEKTDVGFNKEVRRGSGSGERVIYTEERPAFLAKNRWGLPPEIFIGQDKTWGAFHKALNENTGGRYVLPKVQKEVVNDD